MDSLTLYKLIILYMLNKVNFPLTNSQISTFFLEKEYTTYFNLQQAISDLLEANFIRLETIRNVSYYYNTAQGDETLGFFSSQIPQAIVNDIDLYLSENKYELRNEVGTVADYYKATGGEYTVHCMVKEGKTTLIELNITVPSKDDAIKMCDNWKEASQTIYASVMKNLLIK